MNAICKNCTQNFSITDEHLAFYKKIAVPPPTHCPDCRLQRRLAWRNEKSLYKRKCDLCEKDIIAIFPADSKFTIYCQECWWSYNWDPMRETHVYDFSRPFFEQFAELMRDVPFFSLFNQASSLENSEYVNHVTDAKNCYLVFAANFLEDCLYSSFIWECKDTVDCIYSTKLELCYFCLDCDNLFNCQYLQNSKNCHDCILGFELRNCKNCFGCVNLQNKEFYFFNQPLTIETFGQKVAEIKKSPEKFAEKIQEFHAFSLKFPKRYAHQINCESSTGDGIKNCKNCTDCFDGYGGEDLKWMLNFPGETRDCYDISGCAQTELSYECQGIFPGYGVKFSNGCLNNSQNVTYCLYLDGGKECFGCIGTKKAEYCILNKKYSREEYFKLKEKIIAQMRAAASVREDVQYGEFFPINISPFCYNETVAHEHFPLTKEQVLAKGWHWKDDKKSSATAFSSIHEILNCTICQKNYRIIPAEIKFYEKHQLPIPQKCPTCRNKELLSLRNPRKIWQRNCQKCQAPISTTYPPSRPEIVYCEKCFLESP